MEKKPKKKTKNKKKGQKSSRNNMFAAHVLKKIIKKKVTSENTHQLSLLLSFASFSYFWIVRSSTCPLRKSIWPPVVDLPASARNQYILLFKHRWRKQMTGKY